MKKSTLALCTVIVIYALVMILNDGFMATDEYWTGITRYIPAQSSSLQTLVHPDDVKSPLQILPMFVSAQLAHSLGFESPYWQYRFVIFLIGTLNLILLISAFRGFARLTEGDPEKNETFLLLMLAFYFAAPFAFTRPMFESLAAPWLALAAVCALRYDRDNGRKDLLIGVLYASMAFVLRQQLGLCALVFLILPLLKKRFQDFWSAAFLGAGCFILAGIPDLFLRGSFHFSLVNLTLYNFEHGSDYGRQPLTFYPVLLVLISFAPFFITRYPKGFLRERFREHRSLWIILFLFVFLHSLFAQKWERFVISVIPILLFLMFPFLKWMQAQNPRYRLRLGFAFALNGVIFFVASFFPPQKNLIAMSIFLNDHPEIREVYRVLNTPEFITEAFILRKDFSFVDVAKEDLAKVNWSDCSKALVLADSLREEQAGLIAQLQPLSSFSVNAIENLSYRLNPKRNARRVRLNLYGGCTPK